MTIYLEKPEYSEILAKDIVTNLVVDALIL